MAKKLWDKGYGLAPEVELFSAGEDHILDMDLLPYDCLGSMAHAKMLAKIGILTTEEAELLREELVAIMRSWARGEFSISLEEEDVHTAVENLLTGALGDLGKKIHTGRSRNDQVLVDLRLYTKDRLLTIFFRAVDLAKGLIEKGIAHRFAPIAGRTHTRRAMISTVGLWLGSFAQAMLDDLVLMDAAYRMNDTCPLGAAAGFGVNLDLDRELTAELLGFSGVLGNVAYVNLSRGKTEGAVLAALTQVAADLSRLAADLILYSAEEYRYIELPDELCPGSSIMPQKKNPDPLELIRARSATVLASYLNVMEVVRSLTSGYHRDLQETKGPFMRSIDMVDSCLVVALEVVNKMEVNEDALKAHLSPELFATDRAMDLAKEGMPFRDAYRKVAAELHEIDAADFEAAILNKAHTGGPGNPGLEDALAEVEAWEKEIEARAEGFYSALSSLARVDFPGGLYE